MLSFDEVIASRRVREDGRIEILNRYVPYNPDGTPNYDIYPAPDEIDHGPFPVTLLISEPPKMPVEAKVESKAIAVFLENKDWTKKRIAEEIGCHEKSLAPSRCPNLNALIKAHQDYSKETHRIPRGEKSKDGVVEAWCDPQ